MTIPNALSLLRLLSVPIIVWLILTEYYVIAFWVFLISGVSDAIDGFLAKSFNSASKLGAYLDPLADKALLAAVFVTLSVQNIIPLWLVIIVVSRDILILGAVILSWLLEMPITVKPLLISKINTSAQIGLVCLEIASLAFNFNFGRILYILIGVVTILTVSSMFAYITHWIHHMSKNEIY